MQPQARSNIHTNTHYQVILRLRPIQNESTMIECESPNTISIKDISSKTSTEKQTFNFNHIIGADKT